MTKRTEFDNKRRLFKSADGTMRCEGCHLHEDACTCDEDNAVRVIFAAAFDKDANT